MFGAIHKSGDHYPLLNHGAVIETCSAKRFNTESICASMHFDEFEDGGGVVGWRRGGGWGGVGWGMLIPKPSRV